MPGRTGSAFVLLLSAAAAAPAFAQPVTQPSQFQLGKAAIDAHDPAAAIAHFEQADTNEADAWLAVALMMESRSPSDQYVERAFDAAARARAGRPEALRSRADVAAALGPGDVVVTFLVGERYAYAWAFDRDTMTGYPLPPSAAIAAAVERANAYLGQNDRAGAQRIAEDLMPALLGPILDRIPELTRLIFVMDGPLRQLPIGELPVGDEPSRLAQRLAIAIVDDGALFDEAGRTPSEPQRSAWLSTPRLAGAIVIGILLAAGAAALSRRSSVA